MTRMSKNEKRVLFLRCFAKLVLFAERQGIEFIEISGYRTLAEQKALVEAGKSWTMNSRHRLWRAKDIAILKQSRTANGTIKRIINWSPQFYVILGDYWEGLHQLCVFGGRWKVRDYGHFEVK